MASCLGDIHIWSVKNQAIIPDGEIGSFTYHEKNEQVSADHPYIEEKATYTEGRNVTWSPRNKRPDRLKDTLKEVEDLLSIHKCVRSKWLSRRLLQLILGNGIIISLVISIHTGDVDKIFVDKSLVGKLSSDSPSDAVLTEAYLAVVYMDRNKIDYFYFTKRPSGDKKIEKIASYEPKLVQVDLPGPVGRRLNRRLVCNLHQDVIVCWWPTAAGEAQPWSPMVSDKERANLILLTAIGQRFDVLSHNKTDCDPIGIMFSLLQPTQLLTVEQWLGPGGEVNVNTCVYECTRNRVHKVSLTTVSLKSGVTCYDRNLTEDKVVLGCEDGSVVLYDEYKKVTHVTTSSLVPSVIRWHPSGSVMMVANTRGDMQLFDLALSPLKYQLVAENPQATKLLQIAHYLRVPSPLNYMQWSPLVDQPENKMAECNDALFIMFDRGPMVMLQMYLGVLSNGVLSPLSLVHQYIKYRQLDQAIAVLSGLNWNMEGQTCYACLSAVMNHLLRQPLNPDREGHLESVLGTFYAPVRPLSEVTILEYRDPISRLARRFFQVLLRFSRFEKAFLLAVDIGARDLFMDIHYVARDKGESALGEAARRKAEQIDAASLVTEPLEEDEFTEDSELSFSDSDEEYNNAHPGVDHQRYRGPPTASRPQASRTTLNSSASGPRHPSYDAMAGDMQLVNHHSPQLPHYQGRPHLPTQPTYVNMSENIVSQLESELAADLIDEYTELFMDEPILPPPPSHADAPQDAVAATSAPSSIKVIHFGVV